MAAARAPVELGSEVARNKLMHSNHQHEAPGEARVSQTLLSARLLSSASVSPSSLHSITTDSDLTGDQQTREQQVASPSGDHRRGPAPILVKYNYYDYNGERQENHDITQCVGLQQQQQVNSKPIQRQLSPTFKHSLDQIVRSSQNFIKQQQQQHHSNSSSPTSPSPGEGYRPNGQQDQCTMTLLARRYKLSSYEHRCLRCNQTVYQMDKVGPLKDFTFYHQNCFKCRECGTKLTLKTYFNNQHSSTDLEVYCNRHCPKTPAGRLDNQSVGIRAALNAPKVFDPVHQQAFEPSQLMSNMSSHQHHLLNGKQQPQVDSRALHIRHAVQQTRLQSIYKQSQVDQKISQFLNRRLEFLEPKQKMLEMRHREEEEQLFKVFEQKWRQEESQIRDQIRDEWQRELNKLLEKYKRQLSANLGGIRTAGNFQLTNHHNNNNDYNDTTKPAPRIDFHMASSKTIAAPNDDVEEQRMIELERMNLEKTMTIKLDKKKETLKRKLREFERQATAELVEKQSREMLTLISLKLEEFKQEQKRKIGSDLEQFEAMESLANQLGASLQVTGAGPAHLKPSALASGGQQRHSPRQPQVATATSTTTTAGDMPAPRAAQLTKMDLYNSEQADEVFKEIDAIAINVAKEDQRSFTELVHALTRNCLTDVEKVRAIFRWITVKNLNTMQFDASVKPDTPLGLLRGIKQGFESYHVLFKRLCSYAGLHCVVIKGFSKSAGYQPGVRFEGNRFRNSWNAVYVAGAWRFVQCNWGARHLVSVAVMQDKNSSNLSKLSAPNTGRAGQQLKPQRSMAAPPDQLSAGANLGRRGLSNGSNSSAPLNQLAPLQAAQYDVNASGAALRHHSPAVLSPLSPVLSTSTASSSYSTSSSGSSACPSPSQHHSQMHISGQRRGQHPERRSHQKHARLFLDESATVAPANDSLRYEYDDHYFLTDPDEFIYEFFPATPEWQLLRTRPLSLTEFEQLPFVRSLFFKYGLYFAQAEIKSVLYTNSSGATTVKIGMPTHMIPSLIFHYNLKYFDSDAESHEGVSLKRFVMQSVESAGSSNESADSHNQMLLSNVVSFRVHVPENGAYILDIFANSTTPTQYITGEPMKFKSVCKFKIVARNLKTVMVPLPDCASGEFGPMKATRLFGIIPLTHESGLISVQNDKRFLEIQFRMSRPLLDFMASLHKNGHDERQLSKLIKIFIEGDCLLIAIKFLEDGQYGLDIYTRDQSGLPQVGEEANQPSNGYEHHQKPPGEPRKQLLTHCCKYLINVRAATGKRISID